ncbi:MAG: alpha/beta fold hydrolase [Spartobacteria bacterium]|nr:alpha/beta fold hydrolase [Spartobacteria bacterium]
MEKPISFKVNKQQVVGMYHCPDEGEGPFPAVVCFHGFTGNKQESHRLFVKLCRALAVAGMASLRIDFRGSGDSEGDFSMMTISQEMQDARAALKFLRRRAEVDETRIGILGMSMGGLVAAYMLGEHDWVKTGVLWGAVAHPAKSADNKRKDFEYIPAMNCYQRNGWLISEAFVEELYTLDPLEVISNTSASVLLLHGENDITIPVGDAYAYERALKQSGHRVALRVIPESSHTFDSLAWETEVLGDTIAWFRTCL